MTVSKIYETFVHAVAEMLRDLVYFFCKVFDFNREDSVKVKLKNWEYYFKDENIER